MKLRLPHKLQTALLAAVASVSFTTVSSATLGAAAAWAFFSGHAGAEDLTHDPILTQQLDHAKKIEFGKLALSETGAEQVEPSVAKSSFGSGDMAHLAAAAPLGGDIADAVLCEGYSEAGGSWQADAASSTEPTQTSEFVTAEGLAAIGSGESVFVVDTAAPAATTSSLDLAPQQTNSYEGTTGSSSNNTSVSAPAVGAGAGAGSFGGASGYVASSRSTSRPAAMKTAGLSLDNGSAAADTQETGESQETGTLSLVRNELESKSSGLATLSLLDLGGGLDIQPVGSLGTLQKYTPTSLTVEGMEAISDLTAVRVLMDTAAQSGTALDSGDIPAATYTVFSSTTAGVGSRYKVTDTVLNNAGTIILAQASYTADGGTSVTDRGSGQLWLDGNVALTISNNFILGLYYYKEGGYDGVMRIGSNKTFTGNLTLVADSKLTIGGSGNVVTGLVSGNKTLTLNYKGADYSVEFQNSVQLTALEASSGKTTFSGGGNIGTLNLTGGTYTFKGDGKTYEIGNLHMAMRGTSQTQAEVSSGTVVHITGTEVATSAGNGSFLLSHWNANTVLNIFGTLISEAIISSWDAPTATINVKSGGTLELHSGLNRNAARDKSIYLNVENGGRLVAGTAQGGGDKDSLNVTLCGGAVFAGYYGESGKATIARKLTLSPQSEGSSLVNVELADDKVLEITSVVSGSGGINVTGASEQSLESGSLVLSGSNTFTGNVEISGGRVQMDSTAALGSLNTASGSDKTITVHSGGVLDAYGTEAAANAGYSVVLDGGTYTNTRNMSNGEALGSGKRQLVTQLILNQDSYVVAEKQFGLVCNGYGGTSLTLNGKTLEKRGSETFYLVNTTVGEGSIKVTEGAVDFSDSTGCVVNSDIVLSGGVVTGRVSLFGNRTITAQSDTVLANDTAGGAKFNLGRGNALFQVNENKTLEVNGQIYGTGYISKLGEGSLVLNRDNSYSGGTTVDAGTLKLGNAQALGSGAVAVNGGTLDLSSLTSTVSTGALSVAQGATLALGCANALSVGGALSLEEGSFLDVSRIAYSESPVTLATVSNGNSIIYAGVELQNVAEGYNGSLSVDGNDLKLTFSRESEATFHMYILTGQSNSLGSVKDMPATDEMFSHYSSEALLFNGNMHKGGDRYVSNPVWQVVDKQPVGEGDNTYAVTGPEYVFAYMLEKKGWLYNQEVGDSIGIIKGSLDGGGNGYWVKGSGYNYGVLLDTVKKAVTAAHEKGYGALSLDGLMYLQGESNSDAEAAVADLRFNDLLTNLKTDLQEWMKGQGITMALKFQGNSVAGEPATWSMDGKEGSGVAGTVTAGKLIDNATSAGMLNADGNGMGFVFTRDLDKTNVDTLKVHYDGNSQIVIGARYAYAFAVQNGIDVGTVRGQDDSALLNTAAAWWMEKLPTADDVAVWDISSVSQSVSESECNKIADGASITVGGIRIEEVYSTSATALGQGSVSITGGTINIGKAGLEGSGITLQGGDLSISSAVNVVADQTWATKVPGEDGAAAQEHRFNVTGTVTVDAAATLTMARESQVSIGTLSGTGSLMLEEGVQLTLGNAANATYDGSLSGSGSLRKDGRGTQDIRGDLHGYSGTVTASAGKLVLDNTGTDAGTIASVSTSGSGVVELHHMNVSGDLSVSGGELDLAGSDRITATGNLTISTGTSLKFAGADLLQVGGTLTLQSGSYLDLANITLPQTRTLGLDDIPALTEMDDIGTDIVLATAGAIDLQSSVHLTNLLKGYTGTLGTAQAEDGGYNLVLTLAVNSNELIWLGPDGNWSNSTTGDKNWRTAADPAARGFTAGMDVRFDQDSNGHVVTLTETVTAGSMRIDDEVTVTVNAGSNNLTATLKGSGTYAINPGSATLPGGVKTDSADWTGTVKISNVSGSAGYAINLNAMGNAGSVVEFDGVTGYLNTTGSSPFTYTPSIRLSGKGLTIDAGNSNATYTFNGRIMGDGNLNYQLRGSNNHTFVFNGDLRDWNGAFVLKSNHTANLKFAQNAQVVNAAILRQNGTLNVTAETDVAFNKQVQASSLAIAANKTATFNDSLTVAGNVSMDNAGNKLVLAKGATVQGTVNINHGSIQVNGGTAAFSNLDISRSGGGSDASITVAKDAAMAVSTNMWLGSHASIGMDKGGAVTLRNKVSATGLADGGSLLNTGGSTAYGVDSENFKFTNVALSTMGDMTLGNKLESSTLSSAHNVTLNNAGNTLTGTTVTAGTLTVSAGMQLGNLALQGGTLSLTSTSPVSVGSATVSGGATLKLGQANQFTTSGVFAFEHNATLDLSALSISGTESITLGTATTGGSFSEEALNGVRLDFGASSYENAHLEVQGGSLVLSFADFDNNLIWNGWNGTWSSTADEWHKADSAETAVAFKTDSVAIFDSESDGVTATLGQNIDAEKVWVQDGANVMVDTASYTLTAESGFVVEEGATLALAGNGFKGAFSGAGVLVGHTLAAKANWGIADILGGNASLAADWTGTVVLKGGNTNMAEPYVVLDTINQLGNSDSTVRLNGVGGYFTQVTILPALELVNPGAGTPALTITAGNGKTTTFAGAVSGSGDLLFDKNGGSGETFKFQGDISKWTGSLKTGNTNSGALTVQLEGEAVKVNAALLGESTSRALHVAVNTDTEFNNTVKVNDFTVSASHTATLSGNSALRTLKGAGDLVVSGADTTTTINGTSGYTGNLTLKSGTLELGTALTGLSSLTLGNETTIKLFGADKLAATGAITVGEGVTFDLANFNAANLTAGSRVTLATGSSVTIGDALEYQLLNWTAPEGYRGLISADGTHLYLTVAELAHELIWQDSTGTWGARDAWYNKDGDRVTFQDGDDVTINAPYDSVAISVIANATADTMVVQKGEGQDSAYVVVSDTVGSNTISVETLQMKDGTGMTANTRLEVHKTLEMGERTYLELNSQEDATIAADIKGSDFAAIDKNGENSLTLSGDNSGYAGSIVVESGTLVASSENALGSGTVAVDGGAQLTLGTKSGISAGSLSLEDGATLAFIGDSRLTLGYGSEDNGTLTLGSGDNGVYFDLRKYGFGTENTRTLIDAVTLGEGTSLDSVQFLLPTYISEAHLFYDDAKDSIILTFTQAPTHTLYWKGGLGDWTTGTDTKVWHPSETTAELTYFVEGDNVIFDNRSSSSSVSVIDQDIIAGTVTVNNGTRVILQNGVNDATLTAREIDVQGALNTHINIDAETVKLGDKGVWTVVGNNDRTFAGDLAGTGTLVKTGSGELVLSGDNAAFSGTINLAEGIIVAHSANALGTGSTVLFSNGTELQSTRVLHIDGNSFIANAGDAATISASLSVLEGSRAFFNGAGNIKVTGTVANNGTIVKDGTGVLSIGLGTAGGDMKVMQGTLDMLSSWTGGHDLYMDSGSELRLSGAAAVDLGGKLTLARGSALDLSNVSIGGANKVVLTSSSSLDAKLSTDSRLLEGVLVRGLSGGANSGANYVRLEREVVNDKINVVASVHGDNHNGCYWHGVKTDTGDYSVGSGKWIFSQPSDKTTPEYWAGADGNDKLFVGIGINSAGMKQEDPRSAYFFELDGVKKAIVEMTPYTDDGISAIRDMIVEGGTEYVFNDDPTHSSYLNFSATQPSSFVVRNNAMVTVNVGTRMGDQSLLRVEDGSKLVFHAEKEDANDIGHESSLEFYNIENDGVIDATACVFEIKSATNAGEMSMVATNLLYELTSSFYGGIVLREMINTSTGTLHIQSNSVCCEPDGRGFIVNDGVLTFGTLGKERDETDTLFVTVDVSGTGTVNTEGGYAIFTHSIAYDNAGAVTSQNLNIGADVSQFDFATKVGEATTIAGGKEGHFYGASQLGTVEMIAGTAEDETKLLFGPSGSWEKVLYTWAESGYEKADHSAEAVTAGAYSTLEVNNGANVTIDSFNAESIINEGNITVGTVRERTEESALTPATLLVKGDANLDVFTVLDGTATVQGNASLNQIMQSGGKLTLVENSVLNGTEGDGGLVTGGKLELGENVTLDQNAVVTVGENGTYTVVNGTGSRIDASDLELIVDHSTTLYREIVRGSTGIVPQESESAVSSGFMCSGDEYVKLFDTTATGTTLNSGSEAVYHSQASGMMTLIGTDNWEAIKGSIGESEFDVQGHIGYGYLHTSKLGLETYYVRDDYTALDGTDKKVTLDSVFKASMDGTTQKELLNKVVFDVTTHNQTPTADGYNGTLTVDRNTSVDLFAVTTGTKAAINITKGTTVTADADSPGVQGTLHLEGAGVYEITDRNDLGTGISLRGEAEGKPEWDGTVRVTGTSTNLSVEELSVGSGDDASTLEFKYWNGALEGGEHTSDAKVLLTGTAIKFVDGKLEPAAMTLTGADAIDYTFTNTVTGEDARVRHNAATEGGEAGNVVLTFEGDTSDWNGIYEQTTATRDKLTFTGGETVNAGVLVSQGHMDLTYGGTVTTVNSAVTVYKGDEGDSSATVNYTGGTMEVAGALYTDKDSVLTLNVGPADTEGKKTVATFTGAFTGTQNSVMNVNTDSTANIETEAELLRVVGDAGSNVGIVKDHKLVLTGKVPTGEDATYSEFHGLDNQGTIDMQAAGGDIRLVVDGTDAKTFNMGALELTGDAGKAAIETSANEQEVDVTVASLKGPKAPGQVLLLDNQDGNGTVNYHLGGDTAYMGKVQFGSEDTTKSAGATNVVLESDGVAANSVLESVGNGTAADVVVDTANASVQGITSADGDSVRGRLYGTGKNTAEGSSNNQVTITGSDTYSYNGGLGEKLDIAYTGNGKQTFEGGAAGFSGSVTVDNGTRDAGVLEVLNAASMNITDLTIGANNTLAAKAVGGGNTNVTVSGTLLAKGGSTTDGTGNASRMDANLTLASGSTLNVAAAGGTGGLDLGGTLTIASGAMLSQADMATVWNMGVGDKYDLAFNVTGMVGFGNEVDWAQGVDAAAYFGNGMKEGEFYIRYENNGGNGKNVGQVFLYRLQTPEPTTGTLSLLALAALCARRRRKA